MKKLFLLILVVLLALPGSACDICGCGVGSYYLGILPEFSKRFGGLRYQSSSLRSHLSPGGKRSYLTADEIYHKAELWGGWNLGTRFRVLGFVPVNYNTQRTSEQTTRQAGLGDISLMGYGKLLETRGTGPEGKPLIQSLWLGGGIKLATGRYEPGHRDANGQSPNIFQLGTGSTDFMVNAIYDLRYQDAGLNLNVNYKLTTTNRHAYRYGNRLTATLLPYYKFRIAQVVTLAPNAGVIYERAMQDLTEDVFRVDASGGSMLLGGGGLEVSWKRLATGTSFQTPLYQQLAAGTVQGGNRFVTHLTWLF